MKPCDGQFLGLRAFENGRSCGQHNCCDLFVILNDILSFKLSVIDGVDGGMEVDYKDIMPEEVIKCYSCSG